MDKLVGEAIPGAVYTTISKDSVQNICGYRVMHVSDHIGVHLWAMDGHRAFPDAFGTMREQ